MARCYPSAAMAKRTRYPARTSAARPVKRPARAGDPEASPVRAPISPADEPFPVDLADDQPIRASASSLTDDELRRAEELEAAATAKEKAAIAEQLRRRALAEHAERLASGDTNAPLSVRAAHEYAYVARDVKRIGLTAGLMFSILAVLYVVLNVL